MWNRSTKNLNDSGSTVLNLFLKRIQKFGIVGLLSLLFATFSGTAWADLVCSTGQDGYLQITTPLTRVNVYYPAPTGAVSVASGSTSIPIDNPQATNLDSRVSSTIAAGDILIIVQMQGADIDPSDNHFVDQHIVDAGGPTAGSYGDGFGGLEQAGYLPANLTVGHYEYLIATGPVSGGSVPVEGTDGSGGLTNSYSSSDTVSGNSGFRRYQVIKVPQFVNLDITASGEVVPDRWNGRWGGIAALNVQGTLNVTGSINATGRGFRGGQFFRNRNLDDGDSPSGAVEANVYNFGFKGEGIAGSPSRMFSQVLLSENAGTLGEETGSVGYPGIDDLGNTAGYQNIYRFVKDDVDNDALFGNTSDAIPTPNVPPAIHQTDWTRDAGQGAPGNAGSGAGFSEDGGGGGGGHINRGGNGGRGTDNQFSHGIGGGTFFQQINGGTPTATRLAMGGGGGGSNGNNLSSFVLSVSSGQAGGGILYIRANNITGSGTISADGDSAGSAASEGGGGGGAGGTILVHTGTTVINTPLSVVGGTGGSSQNGQDGAGGGGAGGVIWLSDTTHASGAGGQTVTGGAGGLGNALGGGTGVDGGNYNGDAGGVGLASVINPGDPAVPLYGCQFISLGIAKQVNSVSLVSGTTYDIEFGMVIENLAVEDALNIQITDDLAAAFPGVNSIAVTAVNRGTLTAPSTAYDGQSQQNLLAGTDTLAAGASQSLTLNVRVDVGAQTGPFFNQAEISTALLPGGYPQALDQSDDGADPDPDGDGDPSETISLGGDSSENDPTQINLSGSSAVSITKEVTGITQAGSNLRVGFRLVMQNTGTLNLNNLQLIDDVSTQFGSAFVSYDAGSSSIVSSTATTNPNLTDSLPNLFDGTSGQLDIGQQITFDFSVLINPQASGIPDPLTNQATIRGEDIASPGSIVTDISDSGVDPTTTNPGVPGDTGGSDDPTPVNYVAGITGVVWLDTDGDDLLGGSENQLEGWTIIVRDSGGNIVGTLVTTADGSFDFTDLSPGDFTIDAITPGGVTFYRDTITVPNATVVNVPVPIDPSGVVYSSVSRTPIPGVVLDLVDNTNTVVPNACLLPGQSGQVTSETGQYRFDLQLGVAGCALGAGDYSIRLTTIPGGFVQPSTTIFSEPGSLDVTTCPGDATAGAPCNLQTQATPPQAGDSTRYFYTWSLEVGDQDVVNNHIPIDPLATPGSILLSKKADRSEAVIGDIVFYTIEAENTTPNNLIDIDIQDDLPGGFRYVPESALLIREGADGRLGTPDDLKTLINPTGTDPINFGGLSFTPGETIQIAYFTRVSTGVVAGEYVNTATALFFGGQVSNQATAKVRIIQDPILQKTTIIGKVFDDQNSNGVQDNDEQGIPGVRLATVEGLLIETDRYGRYHIADVDGGRLDRGRNFIVKVDPSTLPEGTIFVSENPRVLRITQALMTKFNFAVKLPEPRRLVLAGRPEIRETVTENVMKLSNVVDPIYFDSGKSDIRPEHIKQLQEVLYLLSDKPNVRVHIVGHTDTQLLAPLAAKKYRDNQGLSVARAEETARIFERRMGLSKGSITTSGRAFHEPVATNDTTEGMQLNRRSEIEVHYDIVEEKIVEEKVFVASKPGDDRIILPDGGAIWAVEDPAANDPRLSVMAHSPLIINDGSVTEPVFFSLYSNYKHFIDRWELAIFADTDRDMVKPIATFEGNDLSFMNKVVWDGQGFDRKRHETGAPLTYVLRAFDAEDRMDETAPQFLKTVDADLINNIQTADGFAIYGQSQLATQTIPVHGSRVRLHGVDLNKNHKLMVDDAEVAIADNNSFVIEQHLPPGQHTFDLELETASEEKWTHSVPIDVTGKYMFLVGLANMTVGNNSVSGNSSPLEADDHFDEKIFVDGRLAMYLKGKIKGKYLITAQIDTTEDELRNMGSNLERKDPGRIFRRLDSDKFYPIYGDDSTTISDVDTQGAAYVRVDWDKSNFVWGNYHTGFTGNEFAQYDRSLYGAQLQHRSVNTTRFGDHKLELNGFGSEAQTSFAHNEFSATGGSLYYLRDKDIVQGSEKVWVEIRARDSERILENITLEEGRDYEIDYIQGRLILSRPLTQVANNTAPAIIKDRPLEGNNVYLLSDYEFVEDGFEADKLTAGGRGKVWVTDNLALGATVVKENRSDSDYRMYGTDVTLKIGKGTYVKGEYVTTDARQTDSDFQSIDGGLSFNDKNPINGNDRVDGRAFSLEGKVNLNEMTDDNTDGFISGWYKDRDSGFSAARVDNGIDTLDAGLEGQIRTSENLTLSARGTVYDREGLSKETNLSLQGDYSVTNKFAVGAEIRHEDIEDFLTGEDGSANLLGVSAEYFFTEQTRMYGAIQGTLSEEDNYRDNDMTTLGVTTQVNDRLALKGEVSVGDRGSAYVAGVEYALNDKAKISLSGGFGDGAASQIGTNYTTASGVDLYGTYTIDPDRTGSKRSTLTMGSRREYANGLKLFSENQFVESDQQDGVSKVYGLDFALNDAWSLSASTQSSNLEVSGAEDVERDVLSVGAQYGSDGVKGSTRLEYRKDEGSINATQWLTSNAIEWKQNPSLRWLGKLNFSVTNDDDDSRKDGKFAELDFGAAYRPVFYDKLNLLAKYSFLFDLPSEGQISSRRPNDERSHVLSLEGLYDLDENWELGGKLAYKRGDIRQNRDQGKWFRTGARLAVVRARYHFIKHWDGLAEYRWLQSETEDDMRHGALLGLYRHLGDNVKVGGGYNFTKFDDDLTRQDYDANGWFLDIIGKW
ncbi:MAG: SdrD B-like domain-containing protein [Gammaproteobacteria bacterium]